MIRTIGILAHVDAGKTTFSEQALYLTGALRAPGRVDSQTAFLDSHPLEKQRGITIFSGQARMTLPGGPVIWLDTPGHADFAPEMERALSVMDCAVVLISATEGVQSHAETIWQLLKAYSVPTLFFLNKTDRPGADPEGALRALRDRFSGDVVDMRPWQGGDMPQALREELAQRDEALLEALFDGRDAEEMWLARVGDMLRERRLFPVFSGSALTGEGVSAFLARLDQMTMGFPAPAEAPLRAMAYALRHDAQGGRVCFLKIRSGSLAVREELFNLKVPELRLYHGDRYKNVDRAGPGEIVGVPGLEGVRPGDAWGLESRGFRTEPMLEVDVAWDRKQFPEAAVLRALRQLEEEEPTLSVHPDRGGVSLRIMGKIELEILERLMMDRFGIAIGFGPCRVLYMETPKARALGIGHYEPLRHYAEVHLRIGPGPRGSGVTFRSECHVDDLALNWQRLIETHVLEKAHKGILTGAPLTDAEVVLVSGRAHLKHTEGGDFRQATYRAIRNALMYGGCELLEPVCKFDLRAPAELFGRITGDLIRMGARAEPPAYAGDSVLISGECAYSRFMAYQEGFPALTKGRGSCLFRADHYEKCRDEAQIVAEADYNPLSDDTPDSVFCKKGAGYGVSWDQVRAAAHVEPEI